MEEKKIVKTKIKKIKKKKSKKKRLFSLFIFLLIVGGIICFLLFFPSCGIYDTMTKGFSTRYEFSSQYKASSSYNEKTHIDTLSINWRDGSVRVYTYDGDYVSIKEVANETVTDKFMMHYNYKESDKYGHSMMIQYSKSGNYDYGSLYKDLVVYIPNRSNMSISIHTYNASIDFDLGDNELKELHVNSNHGSVLGFFNSANEVDLLGGTKNDGPSYYYAISSSGTINSLRYSTGSSMSMNLNKVGEIDGIGVCGDIYLNVVEADEVNIKLSSYTLHFNIGLINNINITDKYSNGGKVYLYFNYDASYKINITRKDYSVDGNKVSGETYYNIGNKLGDEMYLIGSGKNSIKIAVSGDLYLYQK
ncbi:MAG: hypothetical protein K6E87_00460 [bacterium]|nr:hypothetical protein [bacterium]